MKTQIDISAEVVYKTSRSGGKGGQNVNKVETKVEARWQLKKSTIVTPEQKELLTITLNHKINIDGYLCVIATEDRTQLGNKILALRKLHEIINKGLVVPKKRTKTKTPKSVIEKRKGDKIKRSEVKEGRKKINIKGE
jgi:ribosome-associated protein